MDVKKLKNAFEEQSIVNEDDVKLQFYSCIARPILLEVNPALASTWKSEDVLLKGGRTDATFQNIVFEYKRKGLFSTQAGINQALRGRDEKDHGLYDYILSHSDIKEDDTNDIICKKITGVMGVGFDGEKFIFARFVPSSTNNSIDISKVDVSIKDPLPIEFVSTENDFTSGLNKLVLLFKQQDKRELNKDNLLNVINCRSSFVRNSIMGIYDELTKDVTGEEQLPRVKVLYDEWNRVFGVMYGEDVEATGFTKVSPILKKAYGIDEAIDIDSKRFLFSLQTFFNMFIKLLVYAFLSQRVDPLFDTNIKMTSESIYEQFSGEADDSTKLVGNFFETHLLEWFIFTLSGFEVDIINGILDIINGFDMSTFVLKREDVQDVLQEIYMELIPKEMRHLMGEYFSPDWIVEHSLDMVGYDGDIEKTLMDPCAGSGPFLTQAIKRIINSCGGTLSYNQMKKITDNVVGFDINPISVVAAKANYIMILFSASSEDSSIVEELKADPLQVPVYIADSVLTPVVYTEESDQYITIQTSVGDMVLPKFDNYREGSMFLTYLNKFIESKKRFELFWALVSGNLHLVDEKDRNLVLNLYTQLQMLHRASMDSFWPIILRNTYAPTMVSNKFDYVVGNPPWIAWKAMSQSYREGTLKIWQSYGIFEKKAYDAITTHDDFGMAVTYVSIDQYLKNGGNMVFLLPASFLKSTKGGEGFRKFRIIRNGQDIPFSVVEVDDFSDVKLFTVPTIAIKIVKDKSMEYPLNEYIVYEEVGKKKKINSHAKWSDVEPRLRTKKRMAQPVDPSNNQSAWLIQDDMTFANALTDMSKERVYKGRKGIEPAGAKGVYILNKPIRASEPGLLLIRNDMSRQRREDVKEKGEHTGKVEEKYVMPMLGGRNIAKWYVKSCVFMLVPHDINNKYGIPESTLASEAPHTFEWLNYYHDELLATREQNGKFFNHKFQPFYRLDNVGSYTYSPYKVLWKEQSGTMAAVVVSSYLKSIPDADRNLFSSDKCIVVDSKVLMLATDNENEAYYVCGIINAPVVAEVIDGYGVATNRGIDVLKYIAIPKYDSENCVHKKIAIISKKIHDLCAGGKYSEEKLKEYEDELSLTVKKIYI